jgi:hypothetical protein
MRRISPRAAVGLLLLCLHASGSIAMAGCKNRSAEKIGSDLARLFLGQAEAFADLNVRAKDCSLDKSAVVPEKQAKRLGSLDDEIDAAVERMNEAMDEGCLADKGPYNGSLGFHLFRGLAEGLSSENALVRWNVLERIHWLCEGRELLPDSADPACKSEVEAAALKVLTDDQDATNRRRALEILANNYATPRAELALEKIATATQDEAEKSLATLALQHLRTVKQ